MYEKRSLVIGRSKVSIGDVILKGMLSRFRLVLITSIDSSTNLSAGKASELIGRFDPKCSFLGCGLLLQGELIHSVANQLNLFTGFDEVWCFENAPNEPKSVDSWIVSPFDIERDPFPSRLEPWMKRTGCQLGLGDGVGLNFVTLDDEIAYALNMEIR